MSHALITSQVENELIATLREQSERYAVALERLAQVTLMGLSGGDGAGQHTEILANVLSEVSAADSRVHALRQRWESLQKPSSPRLRGHLDSFKAILAQLMSRIDQIESQVTQAKSQLQPKLTQAARTIQAIAAYRQTTKYSDFGETQAPANEDRETGAPAK